MANPPQPPNIDRAQAYSMQFLKVSNPPLPDANALTLYADANTGLMAAINSSNQNAMPSGSPAIVYQVTVPLSSAQLLAGNIPVIVVPAVAGFGIIVVAASMLFEPGATPYTPGSGACNLAWDDGGSAAQPILSNGFLNSATPTLQPFGLPAAGPVQANIGTDNLSFVIGSGTLPTLGNGTAKVYVLYSLVAL